MTEEIQNDRPEGADQHLRKAEHDLEKAIEKERGAEADVAKAEAEIAEAMREVTFRIAVNGQAKIWHERKISYEQVVKLAFPDGPTGGNIRYNVSWTRPDGQEGALRPGQSVNVVNEMIFDVRNTDKS